MRPSCPVPTLLVLLPCHLLTAPAAVATVRGAGRPPQQAQLVADARGEWSLLQERAPPGGGDSDGAVAGLPPGPEENASSLDIIGDIAQAVADVGKAVEGVASAVGSVAGGALANITAEIDKVAGVVSGVSGDIAQVAGTGGNSSASNVADEVSSIARSIAGAAGTVVGVEALLAPFRVPLKVGGESTAEVNLALLWIVLFLGACTLLGYTLDRYCAKPERPRGRPMFWLFGLLIGSYAVLIPGLFETLFSFIIALKVLGFHIVVTQDPETHHSGAITESVFSLVGTLFSTGSVPGALFLILYAMVIPAAKLVLLIVGEAWRCSEEPWRVGVARRCIRVVQMVSKWACPDMFAYILLLYLFRSINDRATLIASPAHLDVGFMCFAVFCIVSTFSSLAIPLPPKPQGDGAEAEVAEEREPVLIRFFGRAGVVWATAGLVFLFAIVMTIGLIAPCMSIHLENKLLLQPHGPLPDALAPVLDALNLSSQVDAKVNILACIAALVGWVSYGEAACILAFVLLGGFVVGFVIANMLVLIVAAAGVSQGGGGGEDKDGSTSGGSISYTIAHALKHLAMLDVFIMGVLVVILAAGSYSAQGIVMSFQWGLLVLLVAEVLHYVTYYCVQGAVLYVEGRDEEH